MKRRGVSGPAISDMPIETRARYGHFLVIPTRWMDNDAYLVRAGGLDIQENPVAGVCAESCCSYHTPLAIPEPVEAGLRVGHLGRTSVRYEIGLFKPGEDEAAAQGHFVHVLVARAPMTPAPIPETLRAALERIAVAT